MSLTVSVWPLRFTVTRSTQLIRISQESVERMIQKTSIRKRQTEQHQNESSQTHPRALHQAGSPSHS